MLGKPLTINPPHPLIKAVDDELVLRGMAYSTRKSYGQHLRNYFDWLEVKPEEARREDIRRYLVEMASSGNVSAGYCRGARSALVFLYETVLKQAGKVSDLPPMKRPYQLPVVLSREEVARLFKVTSNLARPDEDRQGEEGSRVAIGQTEAGRYLRVIYVPDPEPGSVFVITSYDLRGKALTAYRRRRRRQK